MCTCISFRHPRTHFNFQSSQLNAYTTKYISSIEFECCYCCRLLVTPFSSAALTQVETGVDLADALAAHYVGLDAPLVAPDNVLAGQFARTSRGGQKQIEFFGETKIRKRQQVVLFFSYHYNFETQALTALSARNSVTAALCQQQAVCATVCD
jgi:hypothetical protein